MNLYLEKKQIIIICVVCSVCFVALLATVYLALSRPSAYEREAEQRRLEDKAAEEAYLTPTPVEPNSGEIFFGPGSKRR